MTPPHDSDRAGRHHSGLRYLGKVGNRYRKCVWWLNPARWVSAGWTVNRMGGCQVSGGRRDGGSDVSD